MAFLTRESIRAKAAAIAFKEYQIDGDTLKVRCMSPAFVDRFNATAGTNIEKSALAILECICDEAGNPLYDSVEEVAKIPGPLFKQLSDAVGRVNDLQTSEEVAKN